PEPKLPRRAHEFRHPWADLRNSRRHRHKALSHAGALAPAAEKATNTIMSCHPERIRGPQRTSVLRALGWRSEGSAFYWFEWLDRSGDSWLSWSSASQASR